MFILEGEIEFRVILLTFLVHVWRLLSEDPAVPNQFIPFFFDSKHGGSLLYALKLFLWWSECLQKCLRSICSDAVQIECKAGTIIVYEEILTIKINFASLNDFFILDEVLDKQGLYWQGDSFPGVFGGKGESVEWDNKLCSKTHLYLIIIRFGDNYTNKEKKSH